MTERIALVISQRLLMYQLIQREEQVWYQYCIQVRLERMSACLIIGLFAVWFHVLPETMVFLLSFFLIRRHAGGFHADSFGGCMIISVGVYLCYVTAFYPFFMHHPLINDGLFAASAVLLLMIGAVNHPNMAWNEKEYQKSKSCTRITVLLEVLGFAVMRLLQVTERYCLFVSFGMILSAAFLALGKLVKQEVE